MTDWFNNRLGHFLLNLMMWSASKLFRVVLVYSPAGVVQAIHFATSETAMEASVSHIYHDKPLRNE